MKRHETESQLKEQVTSLKYIANWLRYCLYLSKFSLVK